MSGWLVNASTATVLMPAALASSSAGISASGSFGLNTIASTSAAMRVRSCWSCSSAVPFWWMTFSEATWPDASASARAVQTCSSRKPLPTPPAFEYPIFQLPAAALGDSAAEPDGLSAGVLSAGAADEGAVVAPPPLLHAAAMSAMAPIATSARVLPSCFMNSVSSLWRPGAPDGARSASFPPGVQVPRAGLSVTHLHAGRSHGRVAAHALGRLRQTAPATVRGRRRSPD